MSSLKENLQDLDTTANTVERLQNLLDVYLFSEFANNQKERTAIILLIKQLKLAIIDLE